MRGVRLGTVVLALALVATPAVPADVHEQGRAITFVGVVADQANLAATGLGSEGWWFPQFAAPAPVTGRPTGENARDALPPWIGAFNHTEGPADPGCTEAGAVARGCLPTYNFRTFSQDGPARSAGGQRGWSRLRLPTGECGRSGAIVDPQTSGENNNNTMNRIQLRDGTPSTFYLAVVVDTTAGDHGWSRLAVRGNAGPLDGPEELTQIEPDREVRPGVDADAPVPNGEPDLYVFRVEKFVDGDYLKLRLRGTATAPASFAGLLFDGDLSGGRDGGNAVGRAGAAAGCGA